MVVSAGALTQAIRNFAKSLEGWLNTAMNAVPQRMIQTKVEICKHHTHTHMYRNTHTQRYTQKHGRSSPST